MPLLGQVGELVKISENGTEELSVEWQIENVLSLSAGSGDFFLSPQFRLEDQRYSLVVYPNWIRYQSSASRWIGFGLIRNDGGPPKTLHFSVGIKVSGEVEKRRELEWKFNGLEMGFFGNVCSRSELLEHETRLMPNRILTIMCVLKKPDTSTVGRCAPVRVLPFPAIELPEVPPINEQQSSDKQGQQSSDECIICCEKSVNCAFNPCGHMACCYNCALRLLEDNSHCCPICRKTIQSILKIYKSM